MTRMMPPLALLTTSLLAACGGGGPDLAPMIGTYHGSIVCTAIVATGYQVTVSSADSDTITVSGADFASFDVDIMDDSGQLTSLADDADNVLSFVDGALSIVHQGADGEVTYTGTLDGSGGDDTSADDTGAGGAATLAAGAYTGSITGPVVSANYTLTLSVVDANTVSASGDGITSFQIPLEVSGSDIQEANWTDGAFTLSGDTLSVTYDPQTLAFTGSR